MTHLNLGGKPLGRRVMGQSRVVIQMEQPDPEGQPNRRKLHVVKSNSLYPAPLGVTMGGGGNEYDTSPPQKPDARPEGSGSRGPVPKKTAIAASWLAKELVKGPAQIATPISKAEKVGISKATLYNAADRFGVEPCELQGKKGWQLAADEVEV